MSERPRWYILDGHTPVATDMIESARWLEANDERRKVAQMTLAKGDERRWVSTVFLSLDHNYRGVGPPLVFETMMFAGDGDSLDCERCSTWTEAESQHARMVAALMAEGWREVAP